VKKPTDLGGNQTGIKRSPVHGKEMLEASRQTTPPPGDESKLADERLTWSRGSDPVGTMPPPLSVKGVAKTVVEAVKGNDMTVLIDKLAERMAFERTGVRLYDALLVKFDAAHIHAGGPTRADLEEIRDEEHQHMVMLKEAIETLGADPTVVTPCANITGVAGQGWMQVLTDPRSTFTQCLEIIMMAELADEDMWLMLSDLAQRMGKDELEMKCRKALVEEEDHRFRVRGWLAGAIYGQAGVSATAPTQPTTTP
jgi:rubrerythrin